MPMHSLRPCTFVLFFICFGLSNIQGLAQSIIAAPDRRADEGSGPYESLLIKGGILIDGTGAPPIGPIDILVKQNRIESVGSVGNVEADKVVDATGMYVLPGFIDMHAHCGSATTCASRS